MIAYIVPQKLRNCGTVVATEVDFKTGDIYAIVPYTKYGGKGYSTHRTEAATIKTSKRRGCVPHKILDAYGIEYQINENKLVKKRQSLPELKDDYKIQN